jgi:hypothetical protein
MSGHLPPPREPLERFAGRLRRLNAEPLEPAGAGAAAVPVPSQLPAPPRSFTGRVCELAALSGATTTAADRRGAVVNAIGGTGGIGKTWLAVRWAHDNLEWFPDGQLYVNLRGFDPSGEPMPPGVALNGFLDALGVSPASIPADLDAKAGLYRGLVANRRMLILLDNARDTAQVAPLLPGSPTCRVLVTSRGQLGGAVTGHGARPLVLDMLTRSEAGRLLAHRLGHVRVAAEPAAVRALVDHCAGLPLALGIVAARAATHPDCPLAVLAGELREESARLDALDAGGLTANLRAVFAASYRSLPAAAAEVFRLLGLVPDPDLSLPAAASLTGLPTGQARGLLGELTGAHLLQEHVAGRYRMHDLVRLYAAQRDICRTAYVRSQ